ncbi:MAG TPA: hypothetical protein VKW09_09280 [bacterium]|nr:hypothetical protein [bacterium]
MVVAVAPVRMMQVPGDEVIHMVAMRHRVVPAARAMRVVLWMLAAIVLRRAACRVGRIDREAVVVHVVTVDVVQVAVVEVIGVVAVLH